MNEEETLKEKRTEELRVIQEEGQTEQRGLTQKKLPILPSAWQISDKGVEAIQKGVAMHQTTYGLYSSIPMICKAEECQYADVCPILRDGACTAGERCPLEISLILAKYEAYMRELDIRTEDAVDMSILRDLIDCDIQIMRSENKMALDGDFTKFVVVSISDSGQPVYSEEITKAAQYKDRIQAKRNKALELLNSTRKDKAGSKLNVVMDPSTYARDLMRKAQGDSLLEGVFDDLDIIPDDHAR